MNHDKVEREMPLGMSLSQRSIVMRSSPRSKPADDTDTTIHSHTVCLRVSSVWAKIKTF